MADIKIQCQACGRELVISQYADAGEIECAGCGAKLRKPGMPAIGAPDDGGDTTSMATAAAAHFRLRGSGAPLKTSVIRPVTAREDPPPARVEERPRKAAAGQPDDHTGSIGRRVRAKEKPKSSMGAWFLFISLAAVLSYLRYLPEVPLERLKGYESLVVRLAPRTMVLFRKAGLVSLALIYLGGILLAWKDEMFQGLLCTIIPLYPFYYVLFVTDAFMLRAVLAALLVAFGKDLTVFLAASWLNTCSNVDAWIMGEKAKAAKPLFE